MKTKTTLTRTTLKWYTFIVLWLLLLASSTETIRKKFYDYGKNNVVFGVHVSTYFKTIITVLMI